MPNQVIQIFFLYTVNSWYFSLLCVFLQLSVFFLEKCQSAALLHENLQKYVNNGECCFCSSPLKKKGQIKEYICTTAVFPLREQAWDEHRAQHKIIFIQVVYPHTPQTKTKFSSTHMDSMILGNAVELYIPIKKWRTWEHNRELLTGVCPSVIFRVL